MKKTVDQESAKGVKKKRNTKKNGPIHDPHTARFPHAKWGGNETEKGKKEPEALGHSDK